MKTTTTTPMPPDEVVSIIRRAVAEEIAEQRSSERNARSERIALLRREMIRIMSRGTR
ncbi:hypothetical protein GE115_00110 [Agromyces sp. CFH 90414]|uniref:Uncharacterized protein n=1 Tax=Agromyces agglutinans TaxID=2662258 RepID=A0A6I2F1H3_9MICO|nr:hypothetical protein [Agromyces agglutinans]MRG58284.1 hypothetical protein [Agromyces agglutinans]